MLCGHQACSCSRHGAQILQTVSQVDQLARGFLGPACRLQALRVRVRAARLGAGYVFQSACLGAFDRNYALEEGRALTEQQLMQLRQNKQDHRRYHQAQREALATIMQYTMDHPSRAVGLFHDGTLDTAVPHGARKSAVRAPER